VCLAVYIVDGFSTGHTRTSLMRASDTGAGGRFSEPEIILPETRALFERQAQRKKKLIAGNSSGIFCFVSECLLNAVFVYENITSDVTRKFTLERLKPLPFPLPSAPLSFSLLSLSPPLRSRAPKSS